MHERDPCGRVRRAAARAASISTAQGSAQIAA
jgi:hypothetical protein